MSKALLTVLFFTALPTSALGIRADYKHGEIKSLCTKSIKAAKTAYEAIAKVPEKERTFDNTTLAFEKTSAELSDEISPLIFMMDVLSDKKLRDEAAACDNINSDFNVDIFTRRDLYNALKSQTGRNADEKRLQFRLMQAFEKNGLKLSDKKLQQVKKLQKALAKIQTSFQKNLNEDASKLYLSDEQLKGLRPDYVASLKKDAKGRRTVAVNEASYQDFMNTADVESTREKMLSSFMNRQGKVNTILMQKAIGLRQELAKLLGYPTWFDYRTETNMAKSAKAVDTFLNDLKDKLAKLNKADMDQLLEFKKKSDPNAAQLNQWDLQYLEYQMKKQNYKVDGDVVREYFPADVAIQGMLDVYSEILGVRYVQIKDAAVWAPNVQFYEVRNKKDDALLAYFYTDFFPREGKYGHAAAFPLIQGRMLNGHYVQPISAIVANLAAPAGDKPSLLTHRDVETMFHEFGHIMHNSLTRAPYGSLAGTSVARDFVEAPSQMLENWVWEPVVLDKISGHYKDHSKKLPKDLLKKMIAARDFQQGRFYVRQLTFGLYDLEIHTAPGKIDVTKAYNDIYRRLTGIEQVKNSHFPATFGHMMGGYDGGYYGYLWSKVYAQDMYTVFQDKGVLSSKAGARYRDDILAPGDMEEPDQLLKKFLGREPNNKAFFKYLHI